MCGGCSSAALGVIDGMQCVAVCCSMLQCVAVRYACVAVYCVIGVAALHLVSFLVLQCVSLCCTVLHCDAVWCVRGVAALLLESFMVCSV